MENYIEFWEYKEPSFDNPFYRHSYINKDKIDSIIIRWSKVVKKFIIVISTNNNKYMPCGINIDPELYMSKEFNEQCYWNSYDDAKKYIENLMNQ